jgi:hypothetical protein
MKKQYYNYHDAVIVNATIEETIFCLLIDLYPIYYPTKPRIVLSFHLPKDNQVCVKWLKKLISESEDLDYFGERLDNLEVIGTENKFYTCKMVCNNMEKLNFKCIDFDENIKQN